MPGMTEEYNEAITSVAEVWRELLKFPDAVTGSTVGALVSVDDGAVTTGEFGRLHG